MSRLYRIRVRPIPGWLDWRRLLGSGGWEVSEIAGGKLELSGVLNRGEAADLSARLRGVGIGGSLLECDVLPPLQRRDLRKAHTEEARRYRNGSKGFELRGARVDDEGRRSLTPEAVAVALGERASRCRVVDAFCGAGGNAIGFARAGCEVVAVEIHAERLKSARHNARIYHVDQRIEFLNGDARSLLAGLKGDLLFVDPPWGERYDKERVTLDQLAPCREVIECARGFPKIWIKVPPSFDPSELPDYRPEALFGTGEGDERRVKFLLMQKGG